MYSADIFRMTEIDELEKEIHRSFAKPVIIFKHSNSCGTSRRAFEQMKKINGSFNVIVVQSARGISNEIESRFGIKHESPQTIILRNGKVVWSASHGAIRAETVEAVLSQHE